MCSLVPFSAEYRNILNDYLLRIASASMRDVTLVILNSLRIKCHIRRPLMQCLHTLYVHAVRIMYCRGRSPILGMFFGNGHCDKAVR